MNNVQLEIKEDSKVSEFYKTANSKITHVGIAEQSPIGYSSLYMHLWKQGIKTLDITTSQVVIKKDIIEKWVIESLKIIAAYDTRINPNNISYFDSILILIKASQVAPDKLVDYNKDLSFANRSDNWFYEHETKYGIIFPKPSNITILNGGFKGWWMKVEDINHFKQNLNITIQEKETDPDNSTGTGIIDNIYKTGNNRQWQSLDHSFIFYSYSFRKTPVTKESLTPLTVDNNPKTRVDLTGYSQARVKVLDKFEDLFNESEIRIWYLVELLQQDDPFAIGERGWMIEKGVACGGSWSQFILLVKEWEAPFVANNESLRNQIRILRRQSHKKDLPFDTVIGAPLDSNDKYISDIVRDSNKWQLFLNVTKSGAEMFNRAKLLDLHHLVVGMDVLNGSYTQSNIFTYEKFRISFEFYLHENYAACTWAGDVGSAVAEHFIKHKFERIEERVKKDYSDIRLMQRLHSESLNYYMKTRAPESDLFSDILSLQLEQLVKNNENKKLSDILTLFNNSSENFEKKAFEQFLNKYNLESSVNRKRFDQQEAKVEIQVLIFLFSYVWMYYRSPVISVIMHANDWFQVNNTTSYSYSKDYFTNLYKNQIKGHKDIIIPTPVPLSIKGLLESTVPISNMFLKWLDNEWTQLSGNSYKKEDLLICQGIEYTIFKSFGAYSDFNPPGNPQGNGESTNKVHDLNPGDTIYVENLEWSNDKHIVVKGKIIKKNNVLSNDSTLYYFWIKSEGVFKIVTYYKIISSPEDYSEKYDTKGIVTETVFQRNSGISGITPYVTRKMWIDEKKNDIIWSNGITYYNLNQYTLKNIYQRIVIHHTDNLDSLVDVEISQQKSRFFSLLGYHFFIKRNGKIYEGRPLEVMGSHAGFIPNNSDPVQDQDWGSIGIVLQGDYHSGITDPSDDAPLTDSMLENLESLIVSLNAKYEIDKMLMHKEVPNTDTVCPGNQIYEPIEALRTKLGLNKDF